MACDDQSVREAALGKAIVFISGLTEMNEEDGKRWWYVVRNGLWKTDGVLTQHDFCKKISAAIFSVPANLVKTFIDTFFVSFGEEWGRVDKWRIEKYLVLVRYFIDKIHEWIKETKDEEYLIGLYERILNMKQGMGLQMQFVDVVTPYVVDFVRNDTKEGSKFVKPFTALFCQSHSQAALVRRIGEKFVTPLIDSEGESLFGNDIDESLRFFRGLVSLLGKCVKEEEPNPQIAQLRFTTLTQCRSIVAAILTIKQAAGEPAAKVVE